MQYSDLTEAQDSYRQFDRRRQAAVRALSILFIVILLCFSAALCFADWKPASIFLFSGILFVYCIIVVLICIYFSKKHKVLYEAAYGNDHAAVPSGLFGEIWEAFEQNQFEGLTYGKVTFAEVYNNTINIEIMYYKHEFDILIDKDTLSMIMDEETDTPIEKEIPLSKLSDIRQVFAVIREFVEHTYL